MLVTRRQFTRTIAGASCCAASANAAAGPLVDWMTADVRTGRILESHWAGAETPVAPGSVLKVVPALAHAIRNGGRFPAFKCGGATEGCWSPKAHGRLDIVRAIALSCNVYFAQLARGLSFDAVALAASELGLEPPTGQDAESWIGARREGWLVTPARLVAAYARLSTRRHDPLASGIIEGLVQSGQSGTASALGGLAMAKTGTSPCAHARKAPGDGWVAAMWPPESPQRVILMRACSEPGSKTARRAKAILQHGA